MIQRMSCCFSIAAFVQTIMHYYCSVECGIVVSAGHVSKQPITQSHVCTWSKQGLIRRRPQWPCPNHWACVWQKLWGNGTNYYGVRSVSQTQTHLQVRERSETVWAVSECNSTVLLIFSLSISFQPSVSVLFRLCVCVCVCGKITQQIRFFEREESVLWASWVSLSISQQCERARSEREGVNGIATRTLNPSEGKFRASWDNVFVYDDNACFQSSSFKSMENADWYFVGRNSFKFYLNTFCISHTL